MEIQFYQYAVKENQKASRFRYCIRLGQYSKNCHLIAGVKMHYNNCVWGGKGCRHILPSEQMWLWKKERLRIEPKEILKTVWDAMKFQALHCIF